MNNLLAVVGMTGSGKSVACDYLEKIGYKKVYFGGVTIEELKKANLELTPETEKMMREKLREDFGMGAYAIKLLPVIEDLYKNQDVVLDGLYSWDELVILKEKFPNLKVIAIVADKDIRYERLAKRNIRPLTNIQAEQRDISEIENIKKGGPIAFADFYLYNNGDLEDYRNNLESILRRI